MTATTQRDTACQLARTDPARALELARAIDEPWFRAQALYWVARYTDADPFPVISEAAKAARACHDDYARSAVRAWEIAVLAERGYLEKARSSLRETVALAKTVTPYSSRSEALYLLLQAALRLDAEEARRVQVVLAETCPADDHWRCKRAVRDGEKLLSGELTPRSLLLVRRLHDLLSANPPRNR